MNIEYLTSAVFDDKNWNLIYFHQNNIIGGMCINYHQNSHIKIEYMVIDERYRQKGFGHLLMNVLKSNFLSYLGLAQIKGICYIVTHAAINAKTFY